MKDKTGFPIPENVVANWQHADDVGREFIAVLTKIIEQIEEGIASKDVIYVEIHDAADLRNARTSLKQIIPYAVCPSCNGTDQRMECRWCKRRGFMSKWHYEKCIPSELRDQRERMVQKV